MRDRQDWLEKRDWQGPGADVTRVSLFALVARHYNRSEINQVAREVEAEWMDLRYSEGGGEVHSVVPTFLRLLA